MKLAVVLLACLLLCSACANANPSPPFVPVPALRPGATVGIVSPAGCISNPSTYQSTLISQMTALNLKTNWSSQWSTCWGYFAGTDAQRAQAINEMFGDPSIGMIMATRGGWGCARILDLLDYDLISRNPKPFMGYSDITTCLNAITQRTGMATFHGPMGLSDWSTGSIDTFWANQVLVLGQLATFKNSADFLSSTTPTTINSGKARGRLIGGNLSVFAAVTGSGFVPTQYQNTVLFLEDTNEYSYSIDRMLTELQLAGVLGQISGFIWGTCTGCTDSGFTVLQVLQQHFQPLGIPAFAGFQFGHIDEQFTLPIGAMVEMDATAFTLTMLEAAVTTNSTDF